jgi:hypothetical protein
VLVIMEHRDVAARLALLLHTEALGGLRVGGVWVCRQ